MPYEIIKTLKRLEEWERVVCEIEQKCPRANLAATETIILCIASTLKLL